MSKLSCGSEVAVQIDYLYHFISPLKNIAAYCIYLLSLSGKLAAN